MTKPRPMLVGELIRLTAIETEDYPAIAGWSNDSEYMRNMRTQAAAPVAVDQVARWLAEDPANANSFNFALRPTEPPEIVGVAIVKDIEWSNRSAWLAMGIGSADHRGRGLGSEALGLLIDFAFDELNLYRLTLSVMAYNDRAIKTYVKHGFVQEGAIREAIERDGTRHNLLIYGLLAGERSG